MSNTPFVEDNNQWLRIRQEDVATINNALAIISGYAQILARQAYIKPEDKKKLEEIVKQVERIAKILQERQPDNPGKREILQDLQEIEKALK